MKNYNITKEIWGAKQVNDGKTGIIISDPGNPKYPEHVVHWYPPRTEDRHGKGINMDEDTRKDRQEYLHMDLLQTVLKFQTEEHPGIAPVVWFPSREQADSFLEFLQAPMRKNIRIRG
nr:hypothetical protein [uncultured Oscillibacter sp.]